MPQFLKFLTETNHPFLGVASFVALLALYLTLLARGGEKVPLAASPARATAGIVLGFLGFYGIYASACGVQEKGWIPVLYVVSAGVFTYAARRQGQVGLFDLFFVLSIWLPIDAGWLQQGWPWPAGGSNAFAIPFAVSLAVLLLKRVRGFSGMKFRLAWSRDDLRIIARNLLPFLAIAIPLGMMTGFIAPTVHPFEPARFALLLIGTFLLVAVPEEFLFRGLIMTGIAKRWQNPRLAMWASSVIFGLSHLNNGSYPDWRYGVLATIAGVFYAKAFTAERSFSPAVIVHTLVDVIWVTFFR